MSRALKTPLNPAATATARTTTTTTDPARSRRLRLPVVVALSAGLLLGCASAASAHVRVLPESTTAGGFTQLTFRVPTESETAGTVALRVDLPTETPLTSVRTKPVPGWTAVIERGDLPAPVEVDGATLTEAPTAVVWTAEPGAEVGPGQYQDFSISVGRLPDAGTEVVLPATQTYSDGEVVAWSQAPLADGSEPELPAPALVTTAAAEEGAGHDAVVAAPAADAVADAGTDDTAAAPAGGSAGADDGARWLGGAGLALGAAALVTALGRRPAGGGHPAA